MASTLASLAEAAVTVFGSTTFFYVVLGAFLGIIFGVIPGLNAPILLSLLIPLTIPMDFDSSMMLLGGALGGTTFAGAITSVLFGVPGTANNIATTLDGFPMGKQGRAAEAISAAASSSFFGTFIGFIVLIAIVPLMKKLVITFGPPEVFWVSMLGIFLISIAARESMFKGLLSGGIGLLLSTHGYSSNTGFLRFTFGIDYLWDGFDTTVVVLGLFGIAEVFNMIVNRDKIAEEDVDMPVKGSISTGIAATVKHFWLVVKSAFIGIVVGIVPGAGAGIADTVAYVAAKKSSKHPDSFGKGEIEGVIAPESSNNAKDQGAMIPLLAFGIPGSLATAILLGAFILHGVQPGPTMLTTNLNSSLALVLAVTVAGLLSTVFGVLGIPIWKKVTKIPLSYLFAFVVGVSTLGIYGTDGNLTDVLVVYLFGILGYFMIRYGFNRVSLMLGLVLGPVCERSFLQSVQISNGSYSVFFRNAVCLILVAVMLLWTFLPSILKLVKKCRKGTKKGGK